MNKLIICSGSIAAVLATASISNTDSAKTIPYPEVMNLTKVPVFDAQGMVPQTRVARNRSRPQQSIVAKVNPEPVTIARANPAPITVDLVSRTVREAEIKKYGGDCPGCRNLSPSMMVMGYSSYNADSVPH
jgi:hypothetical protein